MSDNSKKYFDGQDSDREDALTARQAAELQLGGHAIVDEDGNHVTLAAQEIVNSTNQEELEKAQKASRKEDKRNGTEDDTADVDDGTEPQPELSEQNAPSADQSEHVPKDERGPANANDIGYAPTGL